MSLADIIDDAITHTLPRHYCRRRLAAAAFRHCRCQTPLTAVSADFSPLLFNIFRLAAAAS
jgi:hypothetical protein